MDSNPQPLSRKLPRYHCNNCLLKLVACLKEHTFGTKIKEKRGRETLTTDRTNCHFLLFTVNRVHVVRDSNAACWVNVSFVLPLCPSWKMFYRHISRIWLHCFFVYKGTTDVDAKQCDQIWRNFATLAKKIWPFCEALFSILKTFKRNFGNVYSFGQFFIVVNG